MFGFGKTSEEEVPAVGKDNKVYLEATDDAVKLNSCLVIAGYGVWFWSLLRLAEIVIGLDLFDSKAEFKALMLVADNSFLMILGLALICFVREGCYHIFYIAWLHWLRRLAGIYAVILIVLLPFAVNTSLQVTDDFKEKVSKGQGEFVQTWKQIRANIKEVRSMSQLGSIAVQIKPSSDWSELFASNNVDAARKALMKMASEIEAQLKEEMDRQKWLQARTLAGSIFRVHLALLLAALLLIWFWYRTAWLSELYKSEKALRGIS